jgi:hypothetical protein
VCKVAWNLHFDKLFFCIPRIKQSWVPESSLAQADFLVTSARSLLLADIQSKTLLKIPYVTQRITYEANFILYFYVIVLLLKELVVELAVCTHFSIHIDKHMYACNTCIYIWNIFMRVEVYVLSGKRIHTCIYVYRSTQNCCIDDSR